MKEAANCGGLSITQSTNANGIQCTIFDCCGVVSSRTPIRRRRTRTATAGRRPSVYSTRSRAALFGLLELLGFGNAFACSPRGSATDKKRLLGSHFNASNCRLNSGLLYDTVV